MPDGTSIAMKNLFFNVPARRNFLKSNAAEMRHIVDEFIKSGTCISRIYFFLLLQMVNRFFIWKQEILKQRIVQITGK